jgi:beta-glucosidase
MSNRIADKTFVLQPLDAITAKANTSGIVVTSSLSDDDLNAAAAAATGKDVAFVFITADSGEAGNIVEWNDGGNENIQFYDLYDLTHFRLDRNDLNAWHNGNALVQKVASVNKNTVSLCHSPIYLEG